MTIVHTSPGAGAGMPLDRLLSTSDVVSLHVPLTAETSHLIGQPELARMKRSAYLINTTRGPVVDEAALAWALKNRLIAGAALDVYEREPKCTPICCRSRTWCSRRTSAARTTETRTAMADLAASNVIAVLGGQPPLTPVRDSHEVTTKATNPAHDLSHRDSCLVFASHERRAQAIRPKVERVMRALARAITGLELPAVEKISNEQAEDPFQILIATLLSARTQDATTHAASTRLFKVARTPRTMAKLSVAADRDG